MSDFLRVLSLREMRRFISAFSSRFGSAVLSFGVLLTISRSMPTHEYGLYVFLFSIGSALGLIAVLGQQILVVKHYRRAEPESDPINIALIRVNIHWLGLGCGMLLAAAFILWLIGPSLKPPYQDLWIACLFAAVYSLSEYLQNYFRIHGRINLSLIPREIVWRIASIAAVVCAAAIGWLHGGTTAIIIVTVLLAIATAYQITQFFRTEGMAWFARPAEELASTDRLWHTESLYFIANNVLNACSSYLETIIIGALLGLDKAGFYFVAMRIAMLLTLPIVAIDTVGIPMIAARFQKADTPGAQLLIGRLSFASFVISLLGALALAAIAPHILYLFNKEFVQHSDVLIALCVLAVSQAFFGPGSWLLMIGGGERFFLFARAGLFVLYLVLLYGFGRIGGMMGIACAGVLFNVASNIAASRWIKRKWAIDNTAVAFFRPFLFSHKAKFAWSTGNGGADESKTSSGRAPEALDTECGSGNIKNSASKTLVLDTNPMGQ